MYMKWLVIVTNHRTVKLYNPKYNLTATNLLFNIIPFYDPYELGTNKVRKRLGIYPGI